MIPGYEIVRGNDSGAFTGGGWKLVPHTTEGSSATGAIGAYTKNNSWPHFTLDFDKKRKIQHLEVNVAARSLYNDASDRFDVGRANVVQVELVGFAKDSPSWSKERLDWYANCFVEIRNEMQSKNKATFALQAPEYVPVGKTNAFSDKGWVDYSGVPGHQHAPDNKNGHTDPGKLDIQHILGKMGAGTIPVPPTKGVLVTKTIDYEAVLQVGKDGNGYVDVRHGQGVNPSSVTVTANGGISNGEYPSYSPQFWVARLEGQFVRITSVKNQSEARFNILVSMNFA